MFDSEWVWMTTEECCERGGFEGGELAIESVLLEGPHLNWKSFSFGETDGQDNDGHTVIRRRFFFSFSPFPFLSLGLLFLSFSFYERKQFSRGSTASLPCPPPVTSPDFILIIQFGHLERKKKENMISFVYIRHSSVTLQ